MIAYEIQSEKRHPYHGYMLNPERMRLYITNRKDFDDTMADCTNYSPYIREGMMLEHLICNGLSWVEPEFLGLTEAPALSEHIIDDEFAWSGQHDVKVYHYIRYQIEDFIEVLARDGEVFFDMHILYEVESHPLYWPISEDKIEVDEISRAGLLFIMLDAYLQLACDYGLYNFYSRVHKAHERLVKKYGYSRYSISEEDIIRTNEIYRYWETILDADNKGAGHIFRRAAVGNGKLSKS